MRRRRGASPRGEFEAAKSFATAGEDARKAAGKKTAVLREARQMVARDRALIQLTTESSRTIT